MVFVGIGGRENDRIIEENRKLGQICQKCQKSLLETLKIEQILKKTRLKRLSVLAA